MFGLSTPYAMMIGGALAISMLAGSYTMGRVHQNSAHQQEISRLEIEAFENAAAISKRLTIAESKLRAQRKLLEDAANADTSNNGSDFPTSRVRRLNSIQ